MENITMNFDPLFITLAKKKMRDKNLSEIADISKPVISKMRQNKGQVNAETLAKIMVSLNVPFRAVCQIEVNGTPWKEPDATRD